MLNGNVTVGNRNNGTRPFNGYLDEMQVWNKALSQAEVTDLYARRGFNLFGYEPAVNNLVSWWRTGDIPGDSVDLIQDVQGFANLELIQEYPNAQAITTFVPRENDNDQSFVTEHDTTLNLNGPYQYPSWKQCRTGQHPVARELKEQNIISALLPPAVIGGAPSTSPSGFIDYTEAPLSSRFNSVQFAFEDNTPIPNPVNNVEVIVSYANNLSYFSNEALNTRLSAYRSPSTPSMFSSVVNGSVLGSALSSITEYSERIYPREKYVYQNRVRGRDTYSIANIWNPSRAERLLSASNSQGFTDAASLEYEADSSPWMLDPNYLWTETEYPSTAPATHGIQPPYPNTGSGAGELLNPYCRFGYANTDTVHPAAAYVVPFQAGTGVNVGESLTDFADPYVLQGYHPWTAHSQAEVEPYTKYSTFASDIRCKAKDYSVIPEFRISDLMHDYVVHNNSNFLTTFNNMFNLTGSSVGDSSVTNFYSIYSQTDFMKYFQVVDNALVDRPNAGGTVVRRNTLTLTCNAILKFLPYKGLYPAERTVELASLLSQSLGSFAVEDADQDERVMSRILLEPLVSPGILHNTIKSGVAVSNFVVLNTSSAPAYSLETFAGTGSSPYREYNFNGTAGVKKWALIDERVLPGLHLKASSSTTGHSTGGYYLHKVPFEAFRDPESYLGENVLPGAGAGIADLYDTGILSSSLGHIMSDSSYNFGSDNRLVYRGVPASDLYKLAADNFLCETINFFQPPLKNYLSREETEFLPVQKDLYYGMEVRLYRPTVGSASTPSHDDQFGMYSRASAFGIPVVVSASGGATREVTFSHVTPPYYNGSSRAYIIYKASETGRPTLDDIFANSAVETQRDVDYPGPFTPEAPTSQFLAMQLSESINLLDKLLVVPPGTTTQAARWLLQSKFETPVLNFWGTEVETLPTGAFGNSPIDPTSVTNPFEIRGMWHQYGSLPTLADPNAPVASSAGVYLAINDMPSTVTSTKFGAITVEPLINRVGFEATSEKRLGEIKNVKRVEEAIVVIPFVTNNGVRQFFSISSTSPRYTLQQGLLEKYLFPPTFDYVKNPTVSPIAFYAFEFYHDLTQTDLAKIWQNLPPEINTTFVQSTDSITISQLADAYLGGQNLEWMVFKVKKLAEKDYNLFTKKGLSAGELIEAPAITSPYSYNWPYDYFSLVELIKIDEEVQYATEDIV